MLVIFEIVHNILNLGLGRSSPSKHFHAGCRFGEKDRNDLTKNIQDYLLYRCTKTRLVCTY